MISEYDKRIFAKNLNYYMNKSNTYPADLCSLLNVGKSTVSSWVNAQKMPRMDKIETLAKFFGIKKSYLIEDRETISSSISSINSTEDVVTFRVNVDIAAGYDQPASPLSDWESTTIDVPTSALHGRSQEDFFAVRITGNSMYPHYQDGDCVLIQRADTLDYSGQVGVMLCGDEGTIKKVEYEEGEDWLRLIPFNPEYAPKTIEGSDLEQCRVIGIPKLLIRDL